MMKKHRYINKKSRILSVFLPDRNSTLKIGIISLLALIMIGCEKFVEVDPPKNVLIAEEVFQDPNTVASTIANMYYQMREQGMVSGLNGLSIVMGIYSDELDYYGFSNDYLAMYTHNVNASNGLVDEWWRNAYQIIYLANNILEGVNNATELSSNDKERFMGQAYFVRAYLHSLLVTMYGDVPYITSTDYLLNNKVARDDENEVYEHIIEDLKKASELLPVEDESGERVIPNQIVAKALLSRMHMYRGNWEQAQTIATEVINTTGYYLQEDLDKVFLKNSPETIWQFKPEGIIQLNTYEAAQLIIEFIPGQSYSLHNNLLAAFEQDDLRRVHWVNSISSTAGDITLYFPYKYKQTINTTNESLEFSIVFRMAEQHLIRAEARAHLNNIVGAQNDLNTIRERAGLPPVNIGSSIGLIEAITRERRVELFTEHGHRWFDLKRLKKANQVLENLKPNWRSTDTLFPIPINELEMNPKLQPQNSGY
ncbi:ragB/SusD domain-containing protein [Zhouia amylolytica AD3]|uniref:RagB/SusD domain-containing protein n=2 Tax=Zhouia amylolytica TaxID=376730 RepID=W2UR53_9FLAO|nr:ragB/SusD domain-containing protein [Zhouia amylolytica AD3]